MKIAKQYDTPGWLGAKAQNEAQQAITAVGKNGFAGPTARTTTWPRAASRRCRARASTRRRARATGQDASLAGVQRILAGTQYMTVYKGVTPEAQDAAQLAVAVLKGQQPPAGLVNQQTKSGSASVPSVILTPIATTKSGIKGTVIKDKFWTAAQICTGAYKAACTAAGIQ